MVNGTRNLGLRVKKQPWYSTWKSMNTRCHDSNWCGFARYGGKGIKVDMNFWHVGVLYYRDKADQMKDPTIDRIDNKANYTYKNCRFIERADNTRRAQMGRKHSLEHRRKVAEAQQGSNNSRTKLTEKDVLYIRKQENKQRTSILARMFGVDDTSIRNIQRRKTWKYLT